MAKLKTPEEILFPAKLRSMSLKKFEEFCKAQGWTTDEGWNKTWVDPKGRRWSTLSRLGYLMATSNDYALKNQSLLKAGLAHHVRHHASVGEKGGMERQTQPGTPDVLWALLGSQNLMANAGFNATLKQAFQRVGHARLDWPSSGVGEPGDQGWLDSFLGLAEQLVEEEGPPPCWERWFERWHRCELLMASGALDVSWWDLGQQGSRWFAKDEKKELLPVLPHGSRHTIFDNGRPTALTEENRFSHLWARTVKWAALCAEKATVPVTMGFPMVGVDPHHRLQLGPHLGSEAWEALSQFIRAVLMTPAAKSQENVAPAVVSAMSLWAQGPQVGFSPEEQETLLSLIKQAQEHEAKSQRSNAVVSAFSPELRAWVLSSNLEKTWENVPSNRSRVRM